MRRNSFTEPSSAMPTRWRTCLGAGDARQTDADDDDEPERPPRLTTAHLDVHAVTSQNDCKATDTIEMVNAVQQGDYSAKPKCVLENQILIKISHG